MRIDSFEVKGKPVLPFLSKWNRHSYVAERSFDLEPFELPASATSGSPVLFTDDLFIGFMNDEFGGRFHYDGERTVKATYGENQQLFVLEGKAPYEAWSLYNEAVLSRQGVSPGKRSVPLYRTMEYCTWVEQKAMATEGGDYTSILSESFVESYLERLELLHLPKGKFTIDDGWYTRHSAGGSGTIRPNERFPDLRRMAGTIRQAGYEPGIWLDLGCVSPLSDYYRANRNQVKPHTYWGQTETGQSQPFCQAIPGTAFREQVYDVFVRLIDAGFVKFKIDMLYGNKREMKELMRIVYETAHGIRDDIEIEAHIPDLFVSRYADVVRTNDVLIAEGRDWMRQTLAYWTVCCHSAPNKWLNLDHIGGNDPKIGEREFLTHLNMFRQRPGYPVLSLLPDRFSRQAQEQVRDILKEYDKHKMDEGWFSRIPEEIGN
ncbi:hypothetical protein [Paenibacillus sp. HB172176]|uniref:hypothetical protein n=1 Tax=Paenibacillus sp. HB172176 TaxID=2493690 RepID=UPI00143C47FE|nr:hypothetical protein [Paenibacillus sp. HB172176]